MQIEINGIKYQQREQKENTRATSRMLTALLGMAMMFSPNSGGGKASMPQVDIVEEFKLIQEKKSKLSRAQRDWVCSQFNRMFVKVQ